MTDVRARPASRGRARLVAAVAVSIGVALSVVLVELVLRLLGLGFGNAPLEASSVLHHVHPTDYEFIVHSPGGEYGGFPVRYDHRGFRVAPDGQGVRVGRDETISSGGSARRHVALLGDSFTEANQVAWEDSFGGRIDLANPDVEVSNLGVSSHSPILHLVQVIRTLPDLEPTDIVIQVYANDFGDDEYYLGRADAKDVGSLTAVDGGRRRIAMDVLRRSYVARLVRRVQLDLAHRLEAPAGTEEPQRSLLEPDIEADGPTIRALERISALAEEQGIELFVLFIPNKFHAIESRCCLDDETHRRFVDLMEDRGIRVIDLAGPFSAHPRQPQLFFAVDMHLTPEGHRVVAGAITEALGLGVG